MYGFRFAVGLLVDMTAKLLYALESDAGSVTNSPREFFRVVAPNQCTPFPRMKLKTSLFLLLWLIAGMACGQTLHFGTNRVQPGKLVEFFAPPNGGARLGAQRTGRVLASVKGAFILPPGYTNLARPCPLLIFSVPSGGSSTRGMSTMTNVALTEGWAILAADGPKIDASEDTIQWGWAMLSSVLDEFTKTWPPAKSWPVACAGFSGGAKRSAAVAAAMAHDNWRVIGVFMGGCNEDRATLGWQLFGPGSRFKSVPMFLSNGVSDPIANPQHGATVRDAMIRSGFTAVRLESHPGKHQLSQTHLREALRWFRR